MILPGEGRALLRGEGESYSGSSEHYAKTSLDSGKCTLKVEGPGFSRDCENGSSLDLRVDQHVPQPGAGGRGEYVMPHIEDQ